MIKVAVLDDYQNVFKEFIDIEKYKNKYSFKIFKNPFQNEDEAILELENFNVIFAMRERTKISNSLISGLKNLKYIMTSGMRNKAIDLEEAKKRNIIICGTEIHSNPTAEITWALILGLIRNLKQEVDNMFQGYWQTTIGLELKGKVLGIIGLGKIGSQVAKIGKISGVLLSALIFALAHLSVGELPPLFVLGIGLGLMRLSSGRLFPCALMHSLWNGVTFASLLLVA